MDDSDPHLTRDMGRTHGLHRTAKGMNRALSGSYTPLNIFAKVDLPLPLAPSNAWISPRWNSTLTPSRRARFESALPHSPGGAMPTYLLLRLRS